MIPPESNNRGLPSVNESRLKKGHRWQMLIVIAVLVVIVVCGIWLFNRIKTMVPGASQEKTVETNVGPQRAAPSRVFSFPLDAPPPLPAQPSAASAVSPISVAAPASTRQAAAPVTPSKQAPPVDRMMLADDSQSGRLVSLGNTNARESRRTQPQRATLPTANEAGSDSGPLKALLQPSGTARANAGVIGNRDFMIAKGTLFDCVLQTKLVSMVSGMADCVVPRNVYSDNGKVLLVERGSTVTGEYTSTLSLGQERIFVLWDRIKTTNGIVININSPAADSLGAGGISGFVDNHWVQRIGAAVLLSLVQDSITYATMQQEAKSGGVVVMPTNTSQTSESLAAKILNGTINIPPTITRNQGGRVSIFVARDLDFSAVYGLRPE